MSKLELRELRYFLAVVEEQHFGRAAERLHISQPALSKAVSTMETKLGVSLFDRTTRQTRITGAARALIEPARDVLTTLEVAENLAQRIGQTPVVIAAGASDASLAQRLLDRYALRRPDQPSGQVLVCGWGQTIPLLRRHVVNAAVARDAGLLHDVERVEVAREPRGVMVARSNPLAQLAVISPKDLDGLPQPMWPDSTPEQQAVWHGYEYEPDGEPEFTAGVGPTVSGFEELIEVVALDQAVASVPLSYDETVRHPDVVVRPAVGLTDTKAEFIIRADSHDRHLESLLLCAHEIARDQQSIS
ncbi:MAG TPA: LysR family transcriptional regulator [Baekduia sp.]|nr:LysR family transcriptional regulator [Baekduia sp.]